MTGGAPTRTTPRGTPHGAFGVVGALPTPSPSGGHPAGTRSRRLHPATPSPSGGYPPVAPPTPSPSGGYPAGTRGSGHEASWGASRVLRLVLEYDGARFHGWQAQPGGAGRRTVQEVLETALERLLGERVVAHGAGRTDAGAHALGQVASVVLDRSAMAPEAIRDGLNALVPEDVAVRLVEEAPAGFHARKAAIGKHYRYLLLCRRAPSPLLRGRAWHRRGPLDLAAMTQGAAALVGRHDFSAFRAAAGRARPPVRTLRRLTVAPDPAAPVEGLIRVDLEADGFLMHMARILVGTLVEVGRGRLAPEATAAILAGRDRRAAGSTAPAHGLYLVAVRYPELDKADVS